ncbi:Spy/CpxP family protein refolding chaperone, partial [uncultured Methanobrevibacter sp.]|uniref:Spy/CpxP family protein refolding chaperone n=1 Tax=uncultured Methanobrevibacter sp. TaxID=253161 RepID=UPI00262FAF59
MKGSVKLFIASLLVLACAVGFFLGATCYGIPHFCHKAPCQKGMAKELPINHNHGDKQKDLDKEKLHKGPGPAEMDSILQVTPEQKAELDKFRESMEQSFKVLRKQKMDAEKTLKDALDNGDEAKIGEAKAQILAAQEALLNNRIEGVINL